MERAAQTCDTVHAHRRSFGSAEFSGADVDEEEEDFLFESSDSPLDPTYRLRTKGPNNFLQLSDVLKTTGLTRDEFVAKYSHIEIVSVDKHELESSTIGQPLTTVTNDGCVDQLVVLDDKIRTVLAIDSIKVK